MRTLVYRFGSLGSSVPKMKEQPKETEDIDKHLVNDGTGFHTMTAHDFKDLSKEAKLSGHVQDKIGKLKVDEKKIARDKRKKNKPITFTL